MASTEYSKSEAPLPPPASCSANCFVGDVALRVLLFAASLVAVVVMVTSKQTELVPVPGATALVTVPLTAKFNHSPAFIYFVAALSVACLYSIITTLASLSVILKPTCSKKFLLFFAIFDALIFGIVASATGAAAAIAYVGLKGNDHVKWNKVCNRFDMFCKHVGSSIAMSLLASIILVFLIKLSVYSLYKRIRD